MTSERQIERIPESAEDFRTRVYGCCLDCGRDFPWRHTNDPYRILVSEVMLQQTQTARVVSKYLEFIERFPDICALARAGVAEVLTAWQGLGYNRRALALHRTAGIIYGDFGGLVPREKETLLALPGIGPYTAAAIRAFAFGQPDVLLETNIRTVFIHEFFPENETVPDRDILPIVEATLDRDTPRRWYEALMDYGAMLKDSGNPSRRSSHYRRQSRFKGSRREARGAILRTLLSEGPRTSAALKSRVPEWDSRFDEALKTLLQDGLVVETDSVLAVTP
jgi:A/G-specific adenine glycosylase